ncbi:MAG: ATP phosphoribosyltransferase [Longimicrobiales bacterium]
MKTSETRTLNLALPKGRMQDGVVTLLDEAGIGVRSYDRDDRPRVSVPGYDAKRLKPQNVVEMLHAGSRDVGFAGADWVAELGADLVELVDTGLDPVSVVAASPASLLEGGQLPTDRGLVVASEYVGLTSRWIEERGLNATLVRSYGATEAFPPEDADFIVDNTATGRTLKENGLAVIEVLMTSSTRLFANPAAVKDEAVGTRINDLVLLLKSVLDARQRVMLEVNVSESDLEALVEVLPCMRDPTVARLHGDAGYAVRAAVPKAGLPQLLLAVRACGATDLVVSQPAQIVS